jgi:hypothetical protein
MRQARIGLDHRLLQGVDRVGVDLVGQVARLGGAVEPPPAVLDLLFEGQGVHDQALGRGALFQRLGQAVGGGLAALAVRVGQAVQRLGQGQAFLADLGGQLGQGLVIQPHPVAHGRAAIDDVALQVRRQLVRARQAQAAQPRRPADGRGWAFSAASSSPSSSWFSSSEKNRLSAAICRRTGPQVGLELGPGRVVAGGRGGQARIGAHAPQAVGRLLIELDPAIQQHAQALWLASGLEEQALQRGQFVVGGLGGGQVDLDLRIVATGIEVGEIPLGRGVGLEGRVHGLGYGPVERRAQSWPWAFARQWASAPRRSVWSISQANSVTSR